MNNRNLEYDQQARVCEGCGRPLEAAPTNDEKVLKAARRRYASTYTSGKSKIAPAILRGERDSHPAMERYIQQARDEMTMRESGLARRSR